MALSPSLTEDVEGVVGFDVGGGGVAEDAQHVEEVLKGHAPVTIVRGGEHPADLVLEGVRLPARGQVRASLGSARSADTPHCHWSITTRHDRAHPGQLECPGPSVAQWGPGSCLLAQLASGKGTASPRDCWNSTSGAPWRVNRALPRHTQTRGAAARSQHRTRSSGSVRSWLLGTRTEQTFPLSSFGSSSLNLL